MLQLSIWNQINVQFHKKLLTFDPPCVPEMFEKGSDNKGKVDLIHVLELASTMGPALKYHRNNGSPCSKL